MLRNMVTSLIKHERIMTTVARAKELRRVAEKMVTYAKKNDLHNRRLALRVVRERPMVTKLFEILGPRYQYAPSVSLSSLFKLLTIFAFEFCRSRQGGYTRVMKLGKPRRGDSSDMAFIEFVDRYFTSFFSAFVTL